MIRVRESQSDILQELDHLQNYRRVVSEQVHYPQMIRRCSFAENYTNGRFALIVDAPAPRESGNVPRGGLHSDGIAFSYFPHFVFHLYAHNRSVLNDREQQLVLVENVELVHGPDGIIPSVIRLYLGHDEIDECRILGIYLPARHNTFKLVSRGMDGELRIIVNGSRSVLGERLDPCMVESTPEIVDGISYHEADFAGRSSVSKLVLNELASSLLIKLDRSDVGIFERSSSNINVSDVLIGPFNF